MLIRNAFAVMFLVFSVEGLSESLDHDGANNESVGSFNGDIDFGCPTQGCEPPGTGEFGCPTQGCDVENPTFQYNQTVRAADGTTYTVQSSGTLMNQRNGQTVRVQSIVNGIAYLSDGNHIFILDQSTASTDNRPSTSPTTTLPTPQPNNTPSPQSEDHLDIQIGYWVRPIQDALMYSGSRIMGKIYSSSYYKVSKIQGRWAAVIDKNDSPVSGMVLVSKLVRVSH
jgi:hypothetical protein